MKVPTYDRDTVELARANHQFLTLDDRYPDRITLASALRWWRRDPELIFNLEYRSAGHLEEIAEASASDDSLDELLAASITKDNYLTTMKVSYDQEIAERDQWERSALFSALKGPGSRLSDLIKSSGCKIKKSPKNPKKEVVSCPKVKPSAPKSLIDKIYDLKEGYVLDVSRLTEKGTFARPIKHQKLNQHGSPGLPIVSDNLKTYLLAISMLPGGAEKYAEEIAQVRPLFPVIKEPQELEATEETNPSEILEERGVVQSRPSRVRTALFTTEYTPQAWYV
jgi:hypothetical protein